ncbi:LysR family transcriptional regulator [Epibacterium ulvae]|uniref:LysR family transcriptional regulator n=1 Tax=Epibacterium ulvae TaxID=1156985 RepID=UPI001BFC886E|nr:LysR family transcriptional regulator [Epibacterium ulvae]MBT8152648.1 LysR family transcriptional regulator [Epibacterium ulvae]
MRPNHHQFSAFAYVVREGSFSAAATRLGVTQSTITQHVAKLEQQVGSQLLIRGRNGISVTRTGQEFFALADRLVALDSAISERLEGFETLENGHLKVIANAPQPALEAIRDFAARYPNVEIDFALHDWTTATRLIRERHVDVGIVTDAPVSDEFENTPLHKISYVAYVHPDSPLAAAAEVSLRDLVDQTVILPEFGSLTQRVVSTALKTHNIALPRTIRMTTFPVMCEAVLHEIGIAIFLSRSGRLAQSLVEVPIQELSEQHEISILAPKDRARLRLVRAFIDSAETLAAGAFNPG